MTSDWGGYGGLLKEARDLEAVEAAKPLVSCPICGNVLDKNSHGELNCNVGHYRTTAGATRGA